MGKHPAHAADTYACTRVLSSPDLLEGIGQQVGEGDFQAVVGIESGGLFRLGDPVVYKALALR